MLMLQQPKREQRNRQNVQLQEEPERTTEELTMKKRKLTMMKKALQKCQNSKFYLKN